MGNVIGGGDDNTCFGDKNTISGGKLNSVNEAKDSKYNTISGGWSNQIIDSTAAVITGGGGDNDGKDYYYNNIRNGDTSILSGGSRNLISGAGHTLTGGSGNLIVELSDMSNFGVVTGGK